MGEVTMNKFEDNRIVIRVRDETHVLITTAGSSSWEVLDSSSGIGLHEIHPLGDWLENDILTDPARLCRLGGSGDYPGFDISNVDLYHCYAEEGGCDDYVDCVFGEECDVTDGSRRFLQSGIRIITR